MKKVSRLETIQQTDTKNHARPKEPCGRRHGKIPLNGRPKARHAIGWGSLRAGTKREPGEALAKRV